MAVIWKDVLWCGKWTMPDGRSLNVRPSDLPSVAANGQKMLASRLGIPWCWDHQPDALPVEMSASVYRDKDRTADAARNIITTRTVGFKVGTIQGKPVVLAGFDTSGLPADEIEKVKRTGKVSCRIDRGFWDARGNGTRYPGLSISHIAVTPKPLEPDQGPFFMSAVRSSRETFFLGHATMAKDSDKPDEEDTGSEDTPIETADLEPDGDEGLPPVDAAPAVPAGPPPADPNIQSIIGSAAVFGASIPNDGSINDLQTLALAFKIAAQMKGGMKPDAAPDDGMNATPTPEPGPNPPMMMSQSAMYQIDPERVKKHRTNLEKRIRRLFRNGQVNGPTCNNMLSELKTFQLSYAGQSVVNSGLVATVTGIEKTVPKGTFLAPKQDAGFEMSQAGLTQVPLPQEFDSGNKSAEAVRTRKQFLDLIEKQNPKQ